MFYIICAVVLVGIVTALLFHLHTHQGPRSPALQLLAASLDLAYHEKDNTILDRLKFFKIYDPITLQSAAYNVLRSKSRPPDLWLFDYHARLGLNDSTMRPIQTVCYFSDPRLALPGFRLFPRSAAASGPGNTVFNYRPIIIAAQPHFSARYVLTGPGEQEIRDLFTGEICDYFEKAGEIAMEGFGNELLLYHHRKVLAPSMYQGFHREVLAVYDLFLRSGVTVAASSA